MSEGGLRPGRRWSPVGGPGREGSMGVPHLHDNKLDSTKKPSLEQPKDGNREVLT